MQRSDAPDVLPFYDWQLPAKVIAHAIGRALTVDDRSVLYAAPPTMHGAVVRGEASRAVRLALYRLDTLGFEVGSNRAPGEHAMKCPAGHAIVRSIFDESLCPTCVEIVSDTPRATLDELLMAYFDECSKLGLPETDVDLIVVDVDVEPRHISYFSGAQSDALGWPRVWGNSRQGAVETAAAIARFSALEQPRTCACIWLFAYANAMHAMGRAGPYINGASSYAGGVLKCDRIRDPIGSDLWNALQDAAPVDYHTQTTCSLPWADHVDEDSWLKWPGTGPRSFARYVASQRKWARALLDAEEYADDLRVAPGKCFVARKRYICDWLGYEEEDYDVPESTRTIKASLAEAERAARAKGSYAEATRLRDLARTYVTRGPPRDLSCAKRCRYYDKEYFEDLAEGRSASKSNAPQWGITDYAAAARIVGGT